ncbi:hypothetical protein BH11PLA1_BH11PLA1_12880 [soil metagenome]
MKFNIIGADQDTGETIEMTIEAVDQTAARETASRKGIMVSRVAPLAAHAPQMPAPIYAAPIQQSLEQGHYRSASVINIALPRRGNSLGVVSLILGIVAFFICWIPLVNLVGVPLSALGLLLGLIGLLVAFTRKGASIGYPIAGSAVCGLALFIAISMTGALVGGLKKAGDQIVADSKKRNATNQTAVVTKEQAGEMVEPSLKAEVLPEAAPTPTPVHPMPITERPAMPSPLPAEWASAETAVKQGDVQVQVKAVKVGPIATQETIGEGTGRSKDPLVSIELEITNLSDTKKLNYRTWGGRAFSFGDSTKLTDNFDNGYTIVHFGFGTKIVGSVESESVYPGKAIKDVIAFEEPVSKVEYLNLELPARQFGGTGMLRIRIPASMIHR